MKFYDRTKELSILKRADELKMSRGIMTFVIGRRRVGKTTLLLQPFTNDVKLYFFISRKDESLLCEEFTDEIESKLNITIHGKISKFEEIFKLLLEHSKATPFTIIIDEFQEFTKINPSIYSTIQKLWDLNKEGSKLHLISCGSIYSLMKKIYEDNKEPLFGRADFKLHIQPFRVSTIKEILEDYQALSPQNLLDFYILTGGVAKYIELFALYKAFTKDEMINEIVQENSIFLQEGKNRLIEEFGKEYGIYFSILSLIANSKTSKSEIEGVLERNVSGYLYRLENDYNIIKSIKPINAKPNAKLQKYEIVDNFLLFWFRYIFKYQTLIEVGNFDKLKTIIIKDFSTFSGKLLEKLFIDLLKEENKYTNIGSYWERGNQNEIDIVAIDEIDKELLICEVKLSAKRLNLNQLMEKSQKLLLAYKGYKVSYRLLSVEDSLKI
jgi:hypothetical protein